MLRLWERQIENETASLHAMVERYRANLEAMKARGEGAQLPEARKMMLEWFEPLRDAIAREQQAVRPTSLCNRLPVTRASCWLCFMHLLHYVSGHCRAMAAIIDCLGTSLLTLSLTTSRHPGHARCAPRPCPLPGSVLAVESINVHVHIIWRTLWHADHHKGQNAHQGAARLWALPAAAAGGPAGSHCAAHGHHRPAEWPACHPVQ